MLFNGAAANAEKTADVIDQLSKGDAQMWEATHPTDLVGHVPLVLGGNVPTTTWPGGSFPDSHGSYIRWLAPPGTMVGGVDVRALTDASWGPGQVSVPVRVLPTRLRQQQEEQQRAQREQAEQERQQREQSHEH